MSSSQASAPPYEDALPPGWVEFADGQGRNYYAHSRTQTVSWDRPTGSPPPPPPPPSATAPPAHMVFSGGSSSDDSVMSDTLLSSAVRSDMPPDAVIAQAGSEVRASPPTWSTGVFDCVRPVFDPNTQVGLCCTSWFFPFLTSGSAFSKMGLAPIKNELTGLFCWGWCAQNTGTAAFADCMITSAKISADAAGAPLPIWCYPLSYCAVGIQATIAAAHFRRAMIVSAYNIEGGAMSFADVLAVCCCAPCELNQGMRQLAASPFPPHSFPPSQTGEWSSGLFDCFADDTETAALASCCFPILTARASSFIATRGRSSECLTPFGLTQCLTSPGNALFRRALLRHTFGIKGSFADDFATALLCSCCSLSQEVRHLRRHCGFQPDGSFSGRNFHAHHEN
jgi:Cys-rich protein (TIGR01571 family)